MKKLSTLIWLISIGSLLYAQNVGIDQTAPAAKLDIKGNLLVGSNFSGVGGTPANGAIIQGSVGIGHPTLVQNKVPKLSVLGDSTNEAILFVANGDKLNNFFVITNDGNAGFNAVYNDVVLSIDGPEGFRYLLNIQKENQLKFLIDSTGRAGFNNFFANVGLTVQNLPELPFAFVITAPSGSPLFSVDSSGNASVTNNISKGGGSFKIDHPLYPEEKYLYHSFVESPDMMNIYNGNAITDAQGIATISLPTYFESLNRDVRYQLTCIGTFAQAIVLDEVNQNQFRIKTSEPNVKVSWQVTGIRQDPYANQNRIEVEVEKAPEDKGYYLHPSAYGKPKSQHTGRNLKPVELKREKLLPERAAFYPKGRNN